MTEKSSWADHEVEDNMNNTDPEGKKSYAKASQSAIKKTDKADFDKGKDLGKMIHMNFGPVDVTWRISEHNMIPINSSGFKYQFDFKIQNDRLYMGVLQDKYREWYEITKNESLIIFYDNEEKERYVYVREVVKTEPFKIEKMLKFDKR